MSGSFRAEQRRTLHMRSRAVRFLQAKKRLDRERGGWQGEHATSSPRIVVIAGSAGSLRALIDVLSPLPADFPAAIAVVQHRGATDPDRLVELLGGRTRLRVRHAEDGALLEPGTVYVCPAGKHMTTEHSLRLLDGPKVQCVRPNADLLFESAGSAYGDRAIGIVLSGCGSDAALGSVAIAQAGGTVLAQDDRTCAFSSMPRTAVQTGAVELVLTPAEMAETLRRRLVGQTRRPRRVCPNIEAPECPSPCLEAGVPLSFQPLPDEEPCQQEKRRELNHVEAKPQHDRSIRPAHDMA